MDDFKRLEDGSMQVYVILSLDQIKKVHELFGMTDRDNISQAAQTMIDKFIEEHTVEDVKRIQADDAWENFTNKFNEGWFNNPNQ